MAVLPSNILFPHVTQSYLFVTPWTVARQTPLSMGILQARILEWVPFLSPRDLPDPGIEPTSLRLLLWQRVLYH